MCFSFRADLCPYSERRKYNKPDDFLRLTPMDNRSVLGRLHSQSSRAPPFRIHVFPVRSVGRGTVNACNQIRCVPSMGSLIAWPRPSPSRIGAITNQGHGKWSAEVTRLCRTTKSVTCHMTAKFAAIVGRLPFSPQRRMKLLR